MKDILVIWDTSLECYKTTNCRLRPAMYNFNDKEQPIDEPINSLYVRFSCTKVSKTVKTVHTFYPMPYLLHHGTGIVIVIGTSAHNRSYSAANI
jgi:hypothetical protein